MLKRYGSILNRIEDRYSVPGEVLVAIWGLESDYGVKQGKYSTCPSSKFLRQRAVQIREAPARLFNEVTRLAVGVASGVV
jgi:membrane-bound lytic murein transglycosylase B